MRPTDILLHTMSLGCCVALGAAVWQLHQPPPVPPQAAAPQADPKVAESLQAVQRKLDALRNDLESQGVRLKEIETSPRPSFSSVPAVAEHPAEGHARSDVMSALDDPKIQEKLRKIAVPDQATALQALLGGAEGIHIQNAFTDQEFGGLELNDNQKAPMKSLLDGSHTYVSGLFDKIEKKELTRDQAKDLLKQHRTEHDARAYGLLTQDQYKTYQKNLQPLRMMTDARMEGGLHTRVFTTVNGGTPTVTDSDDGIEIMPGR